MNINENVMESRLNGLSEGAKLALVTCANAYHFGAAWGLLKQSDSDYLGKLKVLKEESSQVRLYQVENGAIVICNEAFLRNIVNTVVPNGINSSFVAMKEARKEEQKKKYLNFVKRIAEGKNSAVKRINGGYEITVGIYCTNEVSEIRLNGITYPAYRLSMYEAVDSLHKNPVLSGHIWAKGIIEENGQKRVVWDKLESMVLNSKGQAAMYRALEMSETGTGVFLTVRFA